MRVRDVYSHGRGAERLESRQRLALRLLDIGVHALCEVAFQHTHPKPLDPAGKRRNEVGHILSG
jgi:hypothetical protein